MLKVACSRVYESPLSHATPSGTRVLTLFTMTSLRNRERLEQYQTIDDAVELIRTSKKILVLTGAGVSVRISLSLSLL